MNTFQKFIEHFKKVVTHKWYVAKYCFKAKLYWQGLTHDLSKFSPVEFTESVKYYNGSHSPIEDCKADIGYSKSWFHHRGRNKHHYEYWCDNFDKGTTCVEMPYRYAVEMLCDFLGAGHAYYGESFTFKKEYEWWVKTKRPVAKMAKYTKLYIDTCLRTLAELEAKQLSIHTIGRRCKAIDEFWDFKMYEKFWCDMQERELKERLKRNVSTNKQKSKPKAKYKSDKSDKSDKKVKPILESTEA